MADTQTFTIEGPDGETDDVELPTGLVDLLREGEESDPQILGDVVLQAMAQQAHVQVHHAEGEVSETMQEINDTAEELFEDRFGIPLSQALGHSH